ncbi:hypothetical protein SAMN05421841_2866 [Chryseobacterium wanjuense]|jgi:hypothetical protein|uniref:Uncharacterized protein n=1 Tax=Chryseobacterium wanjuense TaxID=356305 RepID=A0A1I0RLG2_9FLAO|nr:hypothetical protein [Chryseobacterium wanjuense]SEW41753.1 hypothetical protein SAMN05421841_2866 [Chryseobacterium wanjuense]
MKKITIKREYNQGITILKVLSYFRDKNIIQSIEEIGNYLDSYEKYDKVEINGDSDKINLVIEELNEYGVIYEVN